MARKVNRKIREIRKNRTDLERHSLQAAWFRPRCRKRPKKTGKNVRKTRSAKLQRGLVKRAIAPPLLTGDLESADQRLAEAVSQLPDEPLIVGLQGLLHARRKQSDRALQCVRRALESPRSFGHTHHTYYEIACVYAVGRNAEGAGLVGTHRRNGFPVLVLVPGGSTP